MAQRDGHGQRIVLTGGRGFVGVRLARALRDRWPDAIVTSLGGPLDGPGGMDVTDPSDVARQFEQLRPTAVVHLAAVAAVSVAQRDPATAWSVNLGGTQNVVEGLRSAAPQARLLFVSSAEVYGRNLNSSEPTTEAAALEPVNAYAASKAAADIVVRQNAYQGLAAMVVRPFNHIGAGQSESFVVPAFAAQVARIERGLQPPIVSVGSLDDERDFLDVEDVVAAYVRILDRFESLPNGDAFNVASGRPVRIGDVLEQLLSLSSVRIRIEVDPSRLRDVRVRRVVGDAQKLRAAVDWTPTRDLDHTLTEVLSDQRRRTDEASS